MPELSDEVHEVRDVNGAVLVAGDDVVVIKELKLNGKSGGVKIGTKIKLSLIHISEPTRPY